MMRLGLIASATASNRRSRRATVGTPPEGGIVTAAVAASRTTGTAPLAVHFDATQTLRAGWAADRVFRDCTYSWDYGKAANYTPGNWTISGYSKDEDSGGPIAATVFEEPGTYTVTLDVIDGLGNTDQITEEITVTDPDTDYPTTDTIVVSPTSNFTGSPAGAEQRTTLPSDYNGKRVLLHVGESFGTITIDHADDDVLVSSYGSGAKPVVASIAIGDGRPSSADFPDDIRFVGLDVTGTIQQVSSGSKILFHQLDVDTTTGSNSIQFGAAMEFWAIDDPSRTVASADFYIPSEIFLSEIFARGSTNTGNNIHGLGEKLVVIGCDVRRAAEHTLRIYANQKFFVAHNALRGVSDDGIRHCIKLHAGGIGTFHSDMGGIGLEWATQYGVIARNLIGDASDNNDWQVAISPQNSTSDPVEGVRDVILENNQFQWGTGTQLNGRFVASRITTRGNTRVGGGSLAWNDRGGQTYPGLPAEWSDGPFYGQFTG